MCLFLSAQMRTLRLPNRVNFFVFQPIQTGQDTGELYLAANGHFKFHFGKFTLSTFIEYEPMCHRRLFTSIWLLWKRYASFLKPCIG